MSGRRLLTVVNGRQGQNWGTFWRRSLSPFVGCRKWPPLSLLSMCVIVKGSPSEATIKTPVSQTAGLLGSAANRLAEGAPALTRSVRLNHPPHPILSQAEQGCLPQAEPFATVRDHGCMMRRPEAE